MSAMAKDARRAMRAKAARMASNDPHKKVDASSWTPNEALNADKKTGARPIRPRIYKHGGKIQGDRAPRNAGKACRGGAMAKGGSATSPIPPYRGNPKFDKYNAAVQAESEAKLRTPEGNAARLKRNDERLAQSRQQRADGGKVGTGPLSMANVADENARQFGKYHVGGYAKGGAPKFAAGRPHRKDFWMYQAPDAPSLKAAIEAKAIHPDTTEAEWNKMGPGMQREIMRGKKASGGAAKDVHKHERHMHKGEPLTKLQAGGRTAHARGGRTKGKTNINIVIAQPKGQQADQMPPQGPVRPPMPPPQMPPPAAPPMPQGAPGGAPMAPPPGAAGPMMRASGGRTKGDAITIKHAGAAGGMGRLEKTAIQKRSNRQRGGVTA